MKKALIFDLDGTLADTLPLCIHSFQEALEAFVIVGHRVVSVGTFGIKLDG